jgi:hypothetical protein
VPEPLVDDVLVRLPRLFPKGGGKSARKSAPPEPR